MSEPLQRTDAWLKSRLGKVTASRVRDVLATIKSGEAAARRDYRMALVVERLTGQPADEPYTNADMQRGIDLEPVARSEYEARTGELVEELGLVDHPSIAMFGASPDGRIGATGLEIKAPRPARHVQYIRDGRVPAEYLPQIAAQASCAGFDAVDFVSYCPVMPAGLQLFVVRWQRDDAYIATLEQAVARFLDEVSAEVEALRGLAA